ncbi:MAG: PbpA [Deltaproteobacteria bacterium]|nr:PbpA [Deltaproteobacteria bacterium]
MSYPFTNRNGDATTSCWREYQARIQAEKRRRKRARAVARLMMLLAAAGLTAGGLFLAINVFALYDSDSAPYTTLAGGKEKREATQLDPLKDKERARSMIDPRLLVNLREEGFAIDADGKHLWVQTTLDAGLQRYMLKKMDRVNSRFIGIVAADPATGKIILLSGFNKQDPGHDPCLDNQYPAASIFKIVTAAAAIEQCGLTPGSKMRFNGNAHTLYKRQLKDTDNKYTNHISLKDSFARSVNPVFGKIGSLYLNKSLLEQYAESFGFNQEIDFELELPPSHLSIADTTYNWAEIASGFNRSTTLSPLHGVLMASAVVNKGEMVEPTVIESIQDATGKNVYRCAPRTMKKAILPDTSQVLYDLMKATVRSGTARKTFRGYKRDRVLSKLTIGGKTGSIFNRKHDLRFDWFVGFAEEPDSGKKMAVAVVVAHEEYIGIRAGQYARMAIKKYFQNYFSQNDEKSSRHQPG